ncbi:MAG: FKBP-type peptidyl-prolyl cis-trans isomerase [Muribaculaceae bacterium]|nr:FKBP-type peptidyl-prolyl cis-trans isomerase [Muribaculaceae bacterium]
MKKRIQGGRLFSRLAVAIGVPALVMGISSCSSKAAEKSDSDSVVIDEILSEPEVTTPLDSTAAIFADPAKKSEVATDSTYAVTESGLKYMILREGTGKSPKETDVVTVHYSGNLPDGTVFDSSYDRGEPTSFPLNRVIPGWTEGLQLMKTGGKAVFYIPSNLAYGPTGTPGGPIGPNQDLLFTVELIEVN